jgi:hypothetical protein
MSEINDGKNQFEGWILIGGWSREFSEVALRDPNLRTIETALYQNGDAWYFVIASSFYVSDVWMRIKILV